jgi:hypothetical protein
VSGGFGSATSGNFGTSASSSATKNDFKSASSSAKKARNRRKLSSDAVSASPVDSKPPILTTQSLVDEFVKLNDSRKALQELFDVESDEDEKKSQKAVTRALERWPPSRGVQTFYAFYLCINVAKYFIIFVVYMSLQ